MNSEHIRAWMALHRTPHLSEKSLRRLLLAVPDPEHIFSLSGQELETLGVANQHKLKLTHPKKLNDRERREQHDNDWRLINELGIHVLPISSAHYPELLKQISDPPPLLYVRGDTSLLSRPQLAIVGSRKPTRQGMENALRLASELAAAGFTVTSGLALGIDAHSHQGAIEADGKTVAVLGTGADRPYPASNHLLFHRIEETGAVISEFPLGSEPRRGHFPKRNRVISGLSLGVIVVEAAMQSGSLVSARCALEQNREVFAVPGSIHSPVSRGCHWLIRQGATLIESAADILEDLAGWSGNPTSQPQTSDLSDLTAEEIRLLELLGHDPATLDVLQQRSGLPVAKLSGLLVTLELKGWLGNTAGRYQRIP